MIDQEPLIVKIDSRRKQELAMKYRVYGYRHADSLFQVLPESGKIRRTREATSHANNRNCGTLHH